MGTETAGAGVASAGGGQQAMAGGGQLAMAGGGQLAMAGGGQLAMAVAGVARLVLDFRLAAIALEVGSIASGKSRSPWLVVVLVGALATSYVPLRRWERLGPIVLNHPSLLLGDTVLAVAVLAVAGAESPFFYYTVATAALAGLLYDGRAAAGFSLLLMVGYGAIAAIRFSGPAMPEDFQTLVCLPALYPLAAAAGWAIRDLLNRQLRVAGQLQQSVRTAAAAEERARLAREMHDSVAKTLYGISLGAAALAGWVEHQPDRAVVKAVALARAAETAAAEARGLIANLRADQLDRPLHVAVGEVARRWAEEHQVVLELDAAPVDSDSPAARYELLCILGEALCNTQRHAQARRVTVRLAEEQGMVVLSVGDDGVGFDLGARNAVHGHYGLLGMEERARQAGGRLEVSSQPGAGTAVSAQVPVALADDLASIGRRVAS